MALGLFWASICLCIFITFLAADIMGLFSRKNHFDVDGRTILLTGGSQGMGRGLAKLLAAKGANVVIVARNQQKLDEALSYISSVAKNPQTQRFHAISADMTKPEENASILSETVAWNNGNPPDIVWANAGVSIPTLFIDTPLETLRSQMDINYWAATYLAHATLRLWLRSAPSKPDTPKEAKPPTQPRHFIMTSSVVSFCGLAGYAPYSPAKSAMRSLADTLRSELNMYNAYRRSHPTAGPSADIQIHCVVPGTITSPGHSQEQELKHPVTKVLEESDPAQTEDEVAVASVKGLERGEYLITTQWLGNLMRVGMLGGSPRNNWFLDTVLSWIVSFAWLFIGPDMEGKVWDWGKKNEVNLPS